MKEKGMMYFDTKVLIEIREMQEELKNRCHSVQEKLDAQIIKDCNFFCPLKTGTLQKSAIINTVIGSGLIVWKTPYARAQYYGVDFDRSRDPNPNATALWCEEAKARYQEQWLRLVRDSI